VKDEELANKGKHEEGKVDQRIDIRKIDFAWLGRVVSAVDAALCELAGADDAAI
jgi:hypothetical protein